MHERDELSGTGKSGSSDDGYIDFFAEAEPAATAGASSQAPAAISRFGTDERYLRYFGPLAEQYRQLRNGKDFVAELDRELAREGLLASPLHHARRLSEACGGAQIFLKREDLAHEDNLLQRIVLADALTAQKLGRTSLVTGIVRGRCALHTASVAARIGLRAVIFVDEEFAHKHATDLMCIRLMGARVSVVEAAAIQNGDIRLSALQYALGHPDEAFLVMGLEAGPEPYPAMLHDFSGAIGRDAVRQLMANEQLKPAALVARGSGHPDGIGFLSAFLEQPDLRLVCVEVRSELADTARDLRRSDLDPYDPTHGPLSEQQKRLAVGILGRHDYVSVGREHAALKASGRIEYVQVDDGATRKAIQDSAQLEGYVPPIETAQVLAWTAEAAAKMARDTCIIALIAENSEQGMWDVGRAVKARV